jgi:protein involved in polysaccharide export with SLBB domain
MKYLVLVLTAFLVFAVMTTAGFAQVKLVTPEENAVLGEMRKEEAKTEEMVVKEEAPAAEGVTKAEAVTQELAPKADSYVIGVDDMLDLAILQPEQLVSTVTVSPDGAITVPYAGSVTVKGMSLPDAQELIRSRLEDGYLKYPVVSLSLKQNRSKNFFVYGEVMKPGTYLLTENTTALKAISLAGGFTKFGSSSRVKILRPKKDGEGYETSKVNLDAAMKGNSKSDTVLEPGDMVIVSEGIF